MMSVVRQIKKLLNQLSIQCPITAIKYSGVFA